MIYHRLFGAVLHHQRAKLTYQPAEDVGGNISILQFLANFTAASCLVATLYYTPLLSQLPRGDGPLRAGMHLLPCLGGMVVFSFLNDC